MHCYHLLKKRIAVLMASALSLSFSNVLLCNIGAPAAAAGSDLYVGFPDQPQNYSTVQAGVSAAAQINPTSENERVEIHIAPGIYREQVIINTPYISFVNDTPSQDVVLTWYYGIGYQYYSMGSNGYYDASAAASKTTKGEASRWGCGVRVQSNGDYFRADHITFENSFNRYVTNEEIADGVEPSGSQSITFDRTAAGADVQSKAATERAAAMAVEGDYCEFYQCEFYGSQDTLFTGGAQGYFKECMIEGNTDYIFGTGNYVFDRCELRFKGYSSSATGGYITAHKANGAYLFSDCDITANSGLTVNSGYFGRPWSQDADVAFVNTQLQYADIIKAEGWYKMSGNTPENAKFKEFNTTANGQPVNTSGRVAGTVLSSANGLSVSDYLGGWTPAFLNAASSGDPGQDDPMQMTAVLDAGKIAAGTYSSSFAVNDIFSLTASAEKTITVESKTVSTADGKHTITGLIQMGGGGSADYRSVQIHAAASGVINVYMMSSNAENPRTVNLLDASGNVVSSVENVVGSALGCYTIEIPSAGTYYLTSASSGLNIAYAELLLNTEEEPEVPDIQDVLIGDLNCDSVVNIFDLAKMKQGILAQNLEAKEKLAADINSDSIVNAEDVRLLTALLLGR